MPQASPPSPERRSRGPSAAEAYERLIGRWSRAAAPCFLDFVGLPAAERVLDLGCGTGALTAAMSARWPAASITGVDLDEAHLAACRAAWSGPRWRFVRADAARLPWPAGGFDAALSMLLLMLVDDPRSVATETRRLLRPGGTAAAATWDDGRFELIRDFWDEALALDADAPCRDGRRHCGAPGELAALWHDAGFEEVVEDRVSLTMQFDGPAEIWNALAAGVGPGGRYVIGLPAPARERLREHLARRWSARPGGLRFDAALLRVRGRRPT